jgi:thiopeptide-type bacteriocin biosynthesis protein
MYKALPADLFVSRRPLLPISHYLTVQQQLADGQSLEETLRLIYQVPVCREAIYYASPAVYEQLMNWLEGRCTVSPDYLLTLYKYFVRMATRATPFGLFAGITANHQTNPAARNESDFPGIRRTVVRLSTDYLYHLLTGLTHLPHIREQLLYKPNATIWQGGQTLRYIGYTEHDGQLTYYQQETAANPILLKLLKAIRQGASIAQLTNCLHQNGVGQEEANEYVEALISNQLLIADLGISLSGEDPFDLLIERLDRMTDCQALTDRLRSIRQILSEGNLQAYPYIDQLLAPIGLTMTASFQCDTLFEASPSIPAESLQDQLKRLLPSLVRLHRPVDVSHLDEFRRRFYERFGEQSVPLLLALDPESGIGYGDFQGLPAPWLSGIAWSDTTTPIATVPSTSLPYEELFRRYAATIQRQDTVLRLTAQEIDRLLPAPASTELPYHAYLFIDWLGQDADLNPLLLLKAMGGPSATNLLGRFAHLDPALAANLRQLTQREQATYCHDTLAELVHLPESRTGNMLRRPQLRAHEIPILTSSTIPEQNQLPLDELLISTPNGRQIVLHTRSSDKPILPRLSTAHYVHTGSLAHYRFLYDLQHQRESLRVSWQWGQLAVMPFLPRVQLENIILARAQWRVPISELATQDQWQTWKKTYQVDRYILMGENDNELTIDTSLALCLPLLQQQARRTSYVTLFESPLLTQPTCQQPYCHEMVVPLESTAAFSRSSNRPQPWATLLHQRRFLPGSEWTYVKIYAGAGVIDGLLLNDVGELIHELREQSLIDGWFFIRYADPETHLRLRVHSQPATIGAVIRAINQWITQHVANDNRIYRIQFDTYEREIERYGSETIECCEEWFQSDSDFVLTMLALAGDDPTDVNRLRLACLGVQRMLTAWQLKSGEQIALVEHWRDLFLAEFEGGKTLRDGLNTQFRELKSSLVQPHPNHETTLSDLLKAYEARAASFFDQYCTMAGRTATGAVLPSITHMFVNRLFADDQRRHELVVYYYLHKLLKQWHFSEVRKPST